MTLRILLLVVPLMAFSVKFFVPSQEHPQFTDKVGVIYVIGENGREIYTTVFYYDQLVHADGKWHVKADDGMLLQCATSFEIYCGHYDVRNPSSRVP